MSVELPGITAASLTVDAVQRGDGITLRLMGTADSEVKTDLEAVMHKVHADAMRLAAKKVSVDLRDLEFMNSSCFKVFVTWLATVRELDPAQQYRIHFVSNPEHHWQRRSLAALSCFAVDLVAIDT